MNNGFQIIKVQEEPEYAKLFDMGGELGERVQEMADQDYVARLEDKCDELIETLLHAYYDPSFDEGPKTWSPKAPRSVGPVGVIKLCQALKDGELPETETFIRDSIYFAMDKAFLPTSQDLGYAIQEALDQAADEYGLSDVWLPLLDKAENESEEAFNIVRSLTNTVTWWDEHFQPFQILFNFTKSRKIWQLKESSKDFDQDALDRDFGYLRDTVMEDFWKILKKDMKESDPSNRFEWRKEWKAQLEDKKRVDSIQQELLDYLKNRTFP